MSIMMRREDYDEMVVQITEGRRRRGRPKRRWLDRVKDDIREKGLSGEELQLSHMEAYIVNHRLHMKVQL